MIIIFSIAHNSKSIYIYEYVKISIIKKTENEIWLHSSVIYVCRHKGRLISMKRICLKIFKNTATIIDIYIN